MQQYEAIHLVKSEDLNHHGTLFAARAAAWLVEAGFAAAACEHGNADEIVLRMLHQMSFSKPIQKGSVVKFTSRVVAAGVSSLLVAITAKDAMTGKLAIEGYITFVTIDSDTGKKKSHNLTLDEAADEEERLLRDKAAPFLNRTWAK